MKVNATITRNINTELDILEATLLSVEETGTLLTKKERKYNCWWWLRSPGDAQDDAVSVLSDGSVFYDGSDVSLSIGCIRPALKINLKSSSSATHISSP